VANILVSEGGSIEKEQVILELETEKAVGPIPSPASGRVIKIHVKAGDEVAVGQALISLSEEGAMEKAPKERRGGPGKPQAADLAAQEAHLAGLADHESREPPEHNVALLPSVID